MSELSLAKLIEDGVSQARAGDTLMGLLSLEKAIEQTRKPEVCAWLGFCLAKEKRKFPQALELCREAIGADPKNDDLYLALGRVYLAAGRRRSAIGVLRKGLKMGKNEQIVLLLQKLGLRHEPVFSFLSRENWLNVAVGQLLHKLKLR